MDDQSFRLEVCSYRIDLPGHAKVAAEVHVPPDRGSSVAFTNWIVQLGRFQLLIHLTNKELGRLKESIDYSTKRSVNLEEININGIEGVTYGDYGPPRTWIDWWFRKGDLTICFCLQSISFPVSLPTEAEMEEHRAILGSIISTVDSH